MFTLHSQPSWLVFNCSQPGWHAGEECKSPLRTAEAYSSQVAASQKKFQTQFLLREIGNLIDLASKPGSVVFTAHRWTLCHFCLKEPILTVQYWESQIWLCDLSLQIHQLSSSKAYDPVWINQGRGSHGWWGMLRHLHGLHGQHFFIPPKDIYFF